VSNQTHDHVLKVVRVKKAPAAYRDEHSFMTYETLQALSNGVNPETNSIFVSQLWLWPQNREEFKLKAGDSLLLVQPKSKGQPTVVRYVDSQLDPLVKGLTTISRLHRATNITDLTEHVDSLDTLRELNRASALVLDTLPHC
jgi:hypothetical protein